MPKFAAYGELAMRWLVEAYPPGFQRSILHRLITSSASGGLWVCFFSFPFNEIFVYKIVDNEVNLRL